MHGDRVVVRVEHGRDARSRRRPHRPDPRARIAAHRRPVRRRRHGPRLRRAVRSAPAHRHARPAGESARRGGRRDGHGRDHALADGDASRARPDRRSARPARRARCRHDGHHPQVQTCRTRTATRPSPRPAGSAHPSASATSRAAPISGRGRRSRSTASTRAISTTRISIDRLPNGNFWLGVHIADVRTTSTEDSALDTEAYERAHVRVLSRAGRPHVSVGALDGPLQPQSARRSAGAVVPDGGRPATRARSSATRCTTA